MSQTWSRVRQQLSSELTGCVSLKLSLRASSSWTVCESTSSRVTGSSSRTCEEIGSTVSWSSTTRQRWHDDSDNRNLTIKCLLYFFASLLFFLILQEITFKTFVNRCIYRFYLFSYKNHYFKDAFLLWLSQIHTLKDWSDFSLWSLYGLDRQKNSIVEEHVNLKQTISLLIVNELPSRNDANGTALRWSRNNC